MVGEALVCNDEDSLLLMVDTASCKEETADLVDEKIDDHSIFGAEKLDIISETFL